MSLAESEASALTPLIAYATAYRPDISPFVSKDTS